MILSAGLVLGACSGNSDTVKAPDVEKKPQELVTHGDVRVDEYYWLRERENPEVISYLEKENAYTADQMKDTKHLQKKLYREMVARIKQDDESVPYVRNGYVYYTRYEKGKEYPIYCRKKNETSPEVVLIDVNDLAEGYAYYQVSGIYISPDNSILAFGEDTLSRRKYTLRFIDLNTGKYLEDRIENTPGSVAWANDNKTIFYNTKDETLRPTKSWRHKLGTSTDKDECIFTENDATFYHYVYRSKSGKFIILSSQATLTSEYQYISADAPYEKATMIQKRMTGVEYHPVSYNDYFYIRTNLNAQNFKLVRTPVKEPGYKNWEEVIPHRKDVLLEEVEFFNNYFVMQERSQAQTKLRILSYDHSVDKYIDFDEEAYDCWIGNNPEFTADFLRYGYESMKTPSKTLDIDFASGKKTLKKQRPVLGKFNSDDYETERIWAKAQDGTLIPMSVVYKKGFEKNGEAPCLLYAYGSYGINMTPYFSSVRLSLLDRGFVYVIAHIRGGQEMGRYWYDDGKLLKKMNTFTDYIDCADYLVDNNYTSYDKMIGQGGSAGGLLMGAVANMAPQSFKAIVAQVPFVDVVTTMLDESIPLTTGEFDEWGNPKVKEYYDYIKQYSPYDNVKAMDYPNMLITTGLHDSQVQYWEPAKWCARLRDKKTDDNLLLMNIEMDYGHGGASGRFQVYKEIAFVYAFIMKVLGI